jgi:hypothetical protein
VEETKEDIFKENEKEEIVTRQQVVVDKKKDAP